MRDNDPEKAKARAVDQLEQKMHEAAAKSRSRFWQDGAYNVQEWVTRAFRAALAEVRAMSINPGESAAEFLGRATTRVRAKRDLGPDADLESWFSSAIDEACRIIAGAARSE